MNIYNKIKHVALSLYIKFIYLAFEEVCSDDFGLLESHIKEEFGLKGYLDGDNDFDDFVELFGIISLIEKEYKAKFNDFKQEFIKNREKWKDDINYIIIEKALKENNHFSLFKKEIPFLTLLILQNRIKPFSRYDKEIDKYDLDQLKLVSKNGFFAIERK